MREVLAMIPGTLCDGLLFEPQILGLKDIFDCRVVDHSNSDDLSQVAANILTQMPDKFSVMGLSYGGIIAFELIRQAPKRIKQLILLNTNYKQPSQNTRESLYKFVGMTVLGQFREITTNFLKDAMLYSEHANLAEMRKTVLDMALNTGEQSFFKQVKAQLGRPDSTKILKEITCPVLIISGVEDKVCPVALHQDMAKMIPNSKLILLEKCGHLSTLEQPDAVNRAIRKWYGSLAHT